jgi:hypothetical protein
MTDTPQPSPAEPLAPGFAPVPRERNRHDGWTPERQHGFIEALAELGSVRAAANRVGMTPEAAYQLRRHPDAGDFRKVWETALKHGIRHLEDIAMERAMYGVEVPVYHFGEVVGTRRVYNDNLLMFLLRNRAAKRFSADSHVNADAATQGQLDRLKKKWKAEWDAEQKKKSNYDSEKVLEGLNRKLERRRQSWLADMSPETRAHHEAYQASNRADEERREAERSTRYGSYAIPARPAEPEAALAAPSIKSL